MSRKNLNVTVTQEFNDEYNITNFAATTSAVQSRYLSWESGQLIGIAGGVFHRKSLQQCLPMRYIWEKLFGEFKGSLIAISSVLGFQVELSVSYFIYGPSRSASAPSKAPAYGTAWHPLSPFRIPQSTEDSPSRSIY